MVFVGDTPFVGVLEGATVGAVVGVYAIVAGIAVGQSVGMLEGLRSASKPCVGAYVGSTMDIPATVGLGFLSSLMMIIEPNVHAQIQSTNT